VKNKLVLTSPAYRFSILIELATSLAAFEDLGFDALRSSVSKHGVTQNQAYRGDVFLRSL
jgi:hypothetical protein